MSKAGVIMLNVVGVLSLLLFCRQRLLLLFFLGTLGILERVIGRAGFLLNEALQQLATTTDEPISGSLDTTSWIWKKFKNDTPNSMPLDCCLLQDSSHQS